MAEIYRFKIKKTVKISGPVFIKCSEKNFKLGKKIFDKKHIDYLFEKNVYPYGFDLKNNLLFFLETDSIIDHNKASFFCDPLQTRAKYFIKVNKDDFYEWMKKIKLIDGNNVLFIHHPGRCGSTLLHKILGSNQQIESFSEDLVLDNLFICRGAAIEEIKRLCSNLVTYVYKKWCGETNKILSYKMTGYSRHYVRYLFEVLPQAKHIYLTNDAVRISGSYVNMLSTTMWARYLVRYSGLMYMKTWSYQTLQKYYFGNLDSYYELGILNPNFKKLRSSNVLEAFILHVLINNKYYGSITHKNLIRFHYNDIIEKDKIFRALHDFLVINKENVFDESIFNNHSQGGSRWDPSIVNRFKLSDTQRENLLSFEKYAEELMS